MFFFALCGCFFESIKPRKLGGRAAHELLGDQTANHDGDDGENESDGVGFHREDSWDWLLPYKRLG